MKEIKITVHLSVEEDSETFPVEVMAKSITDLKRELADLCGIDSGSKRILLVLDRKEVIVNLQKLSTNCSYDLTYKCTDVLVKLYLCTI